MRVECGNLWNARSPRGGDPESLLPQNELTFTLMFTRYIQTTPYLITLICILSRGVSSNVNLIALHCAGMTYLWGKHRLAFIALESCQGNSQIT